MRGIAIGVGVLMVAAYLLTAPAYAGNSLLNYLMPSVFGPPETGPKPEETLIAPFAQDAQGSRALGEKDLGALIKPENNIPLNQPHRDQSSVADWAATKTVFALTYNPHQSADELKAWQQGIATAFAAPGMRDLQNYFAQGGMGATLKAQQQKMVAFHQTAPVVANHVEVHGVYRWVIDVPITISTMPATMTDYRGEQNRQVVPTRQNITMRVQVMRSGAPFTDGMAIERFTVVAPSS